MIDQPTGGTGTIARPAAAARRQRGLVPPHPPSDGEKYLYIERNLLYLTTVIFIGSCCLIYSQIRLEIHDLALAPFLLFTVVYVLYQAVSLPVNFAGRGFDVFAQPVMAAITTAPSHSCDDAPAIPVLIRGAGGTALNPPMMSRSSRYSCFSAAAVTEGTAITMNTPSVFGIECIWAV